MLGIQVSKASVECLFYMKRWKPRPCELGFDWLLYAKAPQAPVWTDAGDAMPTPAPMPSIPQKSREFCQQH